MVQDDMQRLLSVGHLMVLAEDNTPMWEVLPEMLDDACTEAYWACLDLKEAYGVESMHWTLYCLDEASTELQPFLSLPFEEREAKMAQYKFNRQEVLTMLQLERMTWNRDTALQLELARTTEIMAERLLAGWSPLGPGGGRQLSDEQALHALALGRLANAYRAKGDLKAASAKAARLREYYVPRSPPRLKAELVFVLGEIDRDNENWSSAERNLKISLKLFAREKCWCEVALVKSALGLLFRTRGRAPKEYVSILSEALQGMAGELLQQRHPIVYYALKLNLILFLAEDDSLSYQKYHDEAEEQMVQLGLAPSTLLQARRLIVKGILEDDSHRAIEYYQAGNRIFAEINQPYDLGISSLYLAGGCLRCERESEALAYIDRALEIFESLDIQNSYALIALHQLADVRKKTAEKTQLLSCLSQTIRALSGCPSPMASSPDRDQP